MPRTHALARKKGAGAGRGGELPPTLGFGVPTTSDPHHFRVTIPPVNSGKVEISEYLGLQASYGEVAVLDRVILGRPRWTAIRREVQRSFNARLKTHGLKTSAWKVGENLVDRLLGKELCVLAWAVETMERDRIPIAVRNWLSLRPEERWWLFGMTAVATGGIKDADRGWRRALEHALGDVAQSDLIQAHGGRKASPSSDPQTLDLFQHEEI